MKKMVFAALSIMTLAACNKKEGTTDSDTMKDTTAVQTETPAAPADTMAMDPKKDTVSVVKTGKSDETTVSAGKEGVTVKSENGDKTTTVEVGKDNSTVKVKK